MESPLPARQTHYETVFRHRSRAHHRWLHIAKAGTAAAMAATEVDPAGLVRDRVATGDMGDARSLQRSVGIAYLRYPGRAGTRSCLKSIVAIVRRRHREKCRQYSIQIYYVAVPSLLPRYQEKFRTYQEVRRCASERGDDRHSAVNHLKGAAGKVLNSNQNLQSDAASRTKSGRWRRLPGLHPSAQIPYGNCCRCRDTYRSLTPHAVFRLRQHATARCGFLLTMSVGMATPFEAALRAAAYSARLRMSGSIFATLPVAGFRPKLIWIK